MDRAAQTVRPRLSAHGLATARPLARPYTIEPMRLLGLLLLCALLLPAQSTPRKTARRKAAPAAVPAKQSPTVPARRATIANLRAEGSKLYPEAAILSLSGLAAGKPGSKEIFDAARDRLLATGFFETIGYRYDSGPDGFALTFEIADIAQVYPVRYTRLGIPDEAANAALVKALPLFQGKLPPTDPVLAAARKALSALASAQGSAMAVSSRVTSDMPTDLHVLFYPTGAPPIVAEVHFRGNKVVPSPVLQLAIHGVAIGTEYREPFFRQILNNAIIPVYEARGRLQVRFPGITIATAEKVKGISVTVEVEEGESYNFGRVSVAGAEPYNEDLLALSKLKEEELANFDEVRAAQARIRDNMRQRGYLRAASAVERTLHEDKHTADLVIRVTPGAQYAFGKLTVTGLDLIGTPAVEKRWALERGKPFNASYPEFFINRIQEERMFEDLGDVRHTLDIHDDTRTVDATLIFIPRKREPKKEKF